MRIGILSDTHDLLRPGVEEALKGCSCILHAGDISSRGILDRLAEIAPVRAVRGNNDGSWAESLPLFLELEAGGLRICMAHKKKDLPADLGPYDLAVFGHSHQYSSAWQEAGGSRTLLLNPGSCGPRRFHQPVTLAVLSVGKSSFSVERIDLPHRVPDASPEASPADLRKQVETVVRETRKGRPVDEIAGRFGIAPETAEQIARLYVTHPGITADGILSKMGL